MSSIDFSELRRQRAESPERIAEALEARQRRQLIDGDGKMMIIACDHPARGALAAGESPDAMANREDLLQRLMLALEIPGVDGILATADLIEDLVVLGALENKLVVGSLNRGGLLGASFEMDDRFGAYTVQGIVDRRLDAAKTLTRINYQDSGTASTLQATAHAVNEAIEEKLPIMIEMFISRWEGKRIVNDINTDAVIRSIAIVQALGTSSAYTWLKIPYVDEMERVMQSTTLPTVILGGDPAATDESLFDSWAHAMRIDGVRGLMVGRSLLFPSHGSTKDAVSRAVEVVHG